MTVSVFRPSSRERDPCIPLHAAEERVLILLDRYVHLATLLLTCGSVISDFRPPLAILDFRVFFLKKIAMWFSFVSKNINNTCSILILLCTVYNQIETRAAVLFIDTVTKLREMSQHPLYH
jgi:hypothetical protein